MKTETYFSFDWFHVYFVGITSCCRIFNSCTWWRWARSNVKCNILEKRYCSFIGIRKIKFLWLNPIAKSIIYWAFIRNVQTCPKIFSFGRELLRAWQIRISFFYCNISGDSYLFASCKLLDGNNKLKTPGLFVTVNYFFENTIWAN